MPIASPAHQVAQLPKAFDSGTFPVIINVVTAMLALTSELKKPPNTMNENTSFSVASGLGKFAKRRNAYAPAIACNAAPPPMASVITVEMAISEAVAPAKLVEKLTKIEPIKMPGQTR